MSSLQLLNLRLFFRFFTNVRTFLSLKNVKYALKKILLVLGILFSNMYLFLI